MNKDYYQLLSEYEEFLFSPSKLLWIFHCWRCMEYFPCPSAKRFMICPRPSCQIGLAGWNMIETTITEAEYFRLLIAGAKPSLNEHYSFGRHVAGERWFLRDNERIWLYE